MEGVHNLLEVALKNWRPASNQSSRGPAERSCGSLSRSHHLSESRFRWPGEPLTIVTAGFSL